MFEAKGEVWLKDDSDRIVLCEMWGKTFASLARDVKVGQAGVPKHSASSARLVRAFPIQPCVEVVRAINFSVVTHDGKSTSLTGESFLVWRR